MFSVLRVDAVGDTTGRLHEAPRRGRCCSGSRLHDRCCGRPAACCPGTPPVHVRLASVLDHTEFDRQFPHELRPLQRHLPVLARRSVGRLEDLPAQPSVVRCAGRRVGEVAWPGREDPAVDHRRVRQGPDGRHAGLQVEARGTRSGHRGPGPDERLRRHRPRLRDVRVHRRQFHVVADQTELGGLRGRTGRCAAC